MRDPTRFLTVLYDTTTKPSQQSSRTTPKTKKKDGRFKMRRSEAMYGREEGLS